MSRPKRFDEIIGQQKVKTVVKVLCESAKARNDVVPHILFSGPSGTGKTTFATVTSLEFGSKFTYSNGSNLTAKSLIDYVSMMNRGDILFIDEIHGLSTSLQESLYTLMEDFRYDATVNGKLKSFDVAPFTLIGATTEVGALTKPMRGRFKFIAEFEDYTLDNLADIVLLTAREYGFKFQKKVAEIIAKTCRGTPRDVVSRTEWIRDYMVANNKTRISQSELLDAISLQGFDADGLRGLDREYLSILNNDSAVSLKTLSSTLNVSQDTVINDIEPYLIRIGKVEITTKGRLLKDL